MFSKKTLSRVNRRFRRLLNERLERRELLTVSAPQLLSPNFAANATADNGSYLSEQTVSADGRYMVFSSDATNLVADDTNGFRDVFFRDLSNNTLTLISRKVGGGTANGDSSEPVVSSDGNYVAFASYATDLNVTGIGSANGQWQIYRWSRLTGTIQLVSQQFDAAAESNGTSVSPSISGDGSKVAFLSTATNLADGLNDANGWYDVFYRDLSTGTNALVSHTATDPLTTANQYSDQPPLISTDGTSIVYASYATDLETGVSDINNFGLDLVRYDVATGLNRYISLESASPSSGNSGSWKAEQSLSDTVNGRFEVFMSNSSDLVPNDFNFNSDVFLRDLDTGAVTLVSRSVNGTSAGGASDNAVISADGNYVAFSSNATDLDTTGTSSFNSQWQIYRWSRLTGEIELVSLQFDDAAEGDGASVSPSISEDGSRIAYLSTASNLISGLVDSNGWYDVYYRDMATSTTALVSHTAVDPLSAGNNYSDQAPRMSRDGSSIVYATIASDLDATVNDINGSSFDLVRYDIATGLNRYVNIQSDTPSTGNAQSWKTEQSLSTSTAGRFEVFMSNASDLVANDVNNISDVFLRNLDTNEVTLISRSVIGTSANGSSDEAVISADGSYVAFTSFATNLDTTGLAATNGFWQVYRWSRLTGTIELVSQQYDGTIEADNTSTSPSINADGSRIAYLSLASNLVSGLVDNNGWYDVYLRDFGTAANVLVSHTSSDPLTSGNDYSDPPKISRDGVSVVYATRATDVDATVSDVNGVNWDIVRYDISSGQNRYVSIETNAAATGNQVSWKTEHSLSETTAGRFEVFISSASNLVANDTNQVSDVFLRDLDTGAITLISRGSDGNSANGASDQAVISANGDYVAFASYAVNLDTTGLGATSGNWQVYRWTRATGVIELVSQQFDGTLEGNSSSDKPSINADGTIIAYMSLASNLIDGLTDPNGWYDVYFRDMASSTTSMVSHVHGDATRAGDGYVQLSPKVSRDGSTIVFGSYATDLTTEADANGNYDLFAYSTSSGTNQLVNLSNAAAATSDWGVRGDFSISADGQRIAYSSWSTDLDAADTDTIEDVFVRDLSAPTSMLVSLSSSSDKGNNFSYSPSINGNGDFVAFVSAADNLVPLDGNGTSDAYVRNITTGTTTRVSLASSGTEADNQTIGVRISHDGSTVALVSYASNLDPAATDSNGDIDVYVRDWQSATPSTKLASINPASMAGNGVSFAPELSDTGATIVFDSYATDLATVVDSNGNANDLFAFTSTGLSLISYKATTTRFTGQVGHVAGFSITDDGGQIAFTSSANSMVGDAHVAGYYHVYVHNANTRENERISVDSSELAGNWYSSEPSISGNGQIVAFTSDADNLVGSDTNGTTDVFVRDRLAGTTELVSVDSVGNQGDGPSSKPEISHAGNSIAFVGIATNLDSAVTDSNGVADVFVRDWQSPSPTTRLISYTVLGTSGDDSSQRPTISDDGSVVVFDSNASDLSALLDVNGVATDVYAYTSAGLQLLSEKSSTLRFTGQNGISSVSEFSMSDSGQFIAYVATSNGLVSDSHSAGYFHVYLHDASTRDNERVSASSDQTPANWHSYQPSVSGDGRFVAFASDADNFDAIDTNGTTDVFVRDRNSATTVMVSVSSAGNVGDGRSFLPRLSRDGTVVAFSSNATNLDSGIVDSNAASDLLLRDWQAASPTTRMISINATAESGDGPSMAPVMNDEGSLIVFETIATDLAAEVDANGVAADIFTYSAGTLQLVTRNDSTTRFTGQVGIVDRYSISDHGQVIAFTSSANGMVDDSHTAGYYHVYVHDAVTRNNERVSVSSNETAGNWFSYQPTLSGDGSYVAFASDADNLIGTDTNGTTDVFVRNRITGETVRVSITDGELQADGASSFPRFSHDGSTVAFISAASNLDAAITTQSGTQNLFVRKWDVSNPTTDWVSKAPDGVTGGDGVILQFALSSNATTIVFGSTSTNLSSISDINGVQDVFAVRLAALSIVPLAANTLEGDTGTKNFTFRINRTGFTGGVHTVRYQVSGSGMQPATADDFGGAFPSGIINFNTGQTSRTLNVAVAGELNVEFDEGFTVTLFDTTENSQIIVQQAVGTIVNNDIDLDVAATDAIKSEGNSGTTPFTFTVTRSGYTGVATTVDWAVTGSGSNPASAADFGGSLPTGTASFAIGETTKVVTVNVSGDQLVELNEGFTITLSNPSGNAEINQSIATGTIQNDDTATVSVEGVSASEATGQLVFTITLTNPVDVATTVQFSTLSSGTAVPGVDFSSIANQVVTFAAGSTTAQTVAVTVDNDNLVELNETVNAQIATLAAGGRSVSLATASATGTITNNDSATVSVAGVSASEATGQLVFTVTLTNPVDVATTVQFSTLASGTAVPGVDFSAIANQVVTFAAGSTTAQTVAVTVDNDNLVELSETVNAQIATLAAGGRSVSLATASATGTITNNDSATVSVAGVSASEATGQLVFTITLTNPVDVATTVQFSTLSSGTAVPGVDFSSIANQVVTFAAGSTTAQTVAVTVDNDNLVELNETVNAQIATLAAGGRSVSLGTASATGTITNNDSATVSVTGISASEATGQLVFTVTLTNPVDVATTVQFSTLASGTATVGTDFGAITDQLVTFAAGSTTAQSVPVSVVNDTLFEPNETVNVEIDSLSAGGRSVTIGSGTAVGTIENDDPQDTVAPTIVSAIASSTSWSAAFIDTIDGGGVNAGNDIGVELLAGAPPLVWSTINRIYVRFSEDVNLVSGSTIELRNSTGLVGASVSYNPTTFVAMIGLSSPLRMSKFRLAISDIVTDVAGNALDGDGNATAGGLYNLRFNVVPGDANRDGRVSVSDLLGFGAAFNAQVGQANYNPYLDWNADGRVSTVDLPIFSGNYNQNIANFSEPGTPFSPGMAFMFDPGSKKDSFFAELGDADDDEKKKLLGDDELS